MIFVFRSESDLVILIESDIIQMLMNKVTPVKECDATGAQYLFKSPAQKNGLFLYSMNKNREHIFFQFLAAYFVGASLP